MLAVSSEGGAVFNNPHYRYFSVAAALASAYFGLWAGAYVAVRNGICLAATGEFFYWAIAAVDISMLLTVASYSSGFVFHDRGRLRHFTSRASIIIALLALALFSSVIINLWLTILAPTDAWDGLDYWATAAAGISQCSIDSSDILLQNNRRHGVFLPVGLSLYSSSRVLAVPLSSVITPAFFFGVTASIMMFSVSMAATRSAMIALITVLVFWSIPLLENQLINFVYSEVYISIFGLMAVLCYLAAKLFGRSWLTVPAIFFSICPLFIRNTGWSYSFVFLMGIAAASVIGALSTQPLKTKQIAYLFMLFAAAAFGVFVISAFPKLLAGKWIIFGKQLGPSFASVESILINEYYSLFANSSFLTLSLIVLTGIASLFMAMRSKKLDSAVLLAAPLSILVVGVLLILISQLTNHGYPHAIPTNDTGNTLFTLPFMVISVALIPIIFRVGASGDGTDKVTQGGRLN